MAGAQVPAEVTAGAEFLDEVIGDDWFEKVNLDTLDLQSGCACVAAQIVGGFEGGYTTAWEYAMFEWGVVAYKNLPEELRGVDQERAAQLGFMGRDHEHWEELEDGWRDLIAARVLARAAT